MNGTAAKGTVTVGAGVFALGAPAGPKFASPFARSEAAMRSRRERIRLRCSAKLARWDSTRALRADT